MQVSGDEKFHDDGDFKTTSSNLYRESDLEPGQTRYVRVAAVLQPVPDPEDSPYRDPPVLSAWTTPVVAASDIPSPSVNDLEVSLSGRDFIEWRWRAAEDAPADGQTIPEYEIQWAFWEDEIAVRDAIRTTDPRFRLSVESDTAVWLRIRRAARSAAEPLEWAATVEGRSHAADCVLPEATASSLEAPSRFLARAAITIGRPAAARRPLVQILRPYDAGDGFNDRFLQVRFLSWTTGHELQIRDRLEIEWPSGPDWWNTIGGPDPELRLRIAAAQCPEAITVRCDGDECTVDP